MSSQKRSFRKVLKDWRTTLSETDGIKPNLKPFWQTPLGKGIRRLTSSEPSSRLERDEGTTWYAGENTDNERYCKALHNATFAFFIVFLYIVILSIFSSNNDCE